MTFDDFKVHRSLIANLRGSIADGRIPHAQFFQGAEGSGNLALAIAYAPEVMSIGMTDMFGQAQKDDRVSKLIHPDVHLVFPVIQGKIKTSGPLMNDFKGALNTNPFLLPSEWLDIMNGGNKVPIISVSESEDIYNKLSLKSYEGGYKVLILWQAETMNAACSNKMLKLIEEPPAKTLILLVGNDIQNLLPTIQSRVQTVVVKPCSDQEINNFLSAKEIEEGLKKSVLQKANGSPGIALSLTKEEVDTQVFESFRDLMRLAFQKNVPSAIEWVETVAPKGKHFHRNLLDFGVDIYRQANMLNHVDNHKLEMDDKGAFIKKFAPFIRMDNIQGLMETHQELGYHLSRNGNARILLLDFTFSLMKLIKK